MHAAAESPTVDPRLARTLWQWLALGALALLAWPAARGHSEALGWAPYWAVVAPAIALAIAYRHRAWPRRAVHAPVSTAHRRRTPGSRAQAHRTGSRRATAFAGTTRKPVDSLREEKYRG